MALTVGFPATRCTPLQHMKFNDYVTIYIYIGVIIIDKATNLQLPHGVGIEDYEKWYQNGGDVCHLCFFLSYVSTG